MAKQKSSFPDLRVRLGWSAGVLVLLVVLLAGASSCSSLSKDELERRLMEIEKNAPIRELGLLEREVRIDLDGVERTLELTYLHVPAASPGDEASRPVVLVHGTPSTLFSWVEIALGGEGFEGLSAQRDVYAIEVPGHGIARGDLSPYSFDRCADFVAASIRALELDRVHLVGSSYGGEFVWRAALENPTLVSSLVLIDSSGIQRRGGDFLPEEVEMRENSLAGWGYLLNSRDRMTTALAPHFDVLPPGRLEEFFLVCENSHNWRAMIDLARDENGTREAELANLNTPTLLIWGGEDIAYEPAYYAARFDEALPRSELLILPSTGHYPHEQRPAEVVRALDTFFAEQDS